MFDDSVRLSPTAFTQRYAITPGYMIDPIRTSGTWAVLRPDGID